MSLLPKVEGIDLQTAVRLKRRLAEGFREQLTLDEPTDEDEAGLRRLAAQLRAGKLIVKLFLRHPLHAKLYLLFHSDPINPIIGFLGSSNLTFAGLAQQGELNVDVLDHDACAKLAKWFEDRWGDRFCLDISTELLAPVRGLSSSRKVTTRSSTSGLGIRLAGSPRGRRCSTARRGGRADSRFGERAGGADPSYRHPHFIFDTWLLPL